MVAHTLHLGLSSGVVGPTTGYLLDAITPQPTGAYSTRKLKSGITNSVRLCDQTGGNPQTIGFSGSDDMDTAAVNAFYAGVGAGCANISGIYDQSGNGRNYLGPLGSVAFKWAVADGGAQQTMNGYPALFFTGLTYNRNRLTGGGFLSNYITATAFTVITTMRVRQWMPPVAMNPETGFWQDGGLGYFGSSMPLDITSAPATGGPKIQGYLYDGSDKLVRVSGAINTNYVCVHRLLSGTMDLWVNGVTNHASIACGAVGDLNYAATTFDAGPNDLYMLEHLVYNTGLSNANINALCTTSGIINGNLAERAGVTWVNI